MVEHSTSVWVCAQPPSPFRFTPRHAECSFFSGSESHGLRRSHVRQAEKFLPHFAAVGGVSRIILQSGNQ